MKRVSVVLLFFLMLMLAVISVGCSNSFSDSSKEDEEASNTVFGTDLIFTGAIQKDTPELGSILYYETPYEKIIISFTDYIKVKEDSNWSVSSDIYGRLQIPSKTANLVEGDNIFFILVSDNQGRTKQYTILIYREKAIEYTVTFKVDDEEYSSIIIKKGDKILPPSLNPEKDGYTFDRWDFDFDTIIEKDTVVFAIMVKNASLGLLYEYNDYYEGYIVSKGSCLDKNLLIPSTYNNKPVIGIGFCGFKMCDFIETVEISNGVKYMFAGCFEDCINIISVNLPNTIETVTGFEGCEKLSSILIPKSTRSLGQEAFADCDGLHSLLLQEGLTEIQDQAFRNCTDIESVSFPSSLESICSNAFENCSKIKSVFIPKNVSRIDKNPFLGCSNLSSIIVDSSNTFFKSENNCCIETERSALIFGCNSSSIPLAGVKIIGQQAFARVQKEYFLIPNGVIEIDSYAFVNNQLLTSVEIPNSVTAMGVGVFQGCVNVESIKIGNGISQIDSSAFYNYDKLKSVYIGGGVKEIGSNAFAHCDQLTTVVLSNGLISIGSYAFGSCYNIENLIIPDSVENIGKQSFYYCTGLKNITIGNAVKEIGREAFYCCKGVKSLKYMGTSTQWNNIKKGTEWNRSLGTNIISCTDGIIEL